MTIYVLRRFCQAVYIVIAKSKFNMSKQAVLVVDLQNEYLATGKLPLVNIDRAVQNAAKVIAAARSKHIPVIHIRHEDRS